MHWHPGWIFALWLGGTAVGAGLTIAILEFPPFVIIALIGLAVSFAAFGSAK